MADAYAAKPVSAEIHALGLGAPLADPVSVWPQTTVIELVREAADLLGEDPVLTLRVAIAKQAGVAVEAVDGIAASRTPMGSALVRLGSASSATRALDVAARRRATNAAEALHAAVLQTS